MEQSESRLPRRSYDRPVFIEGIQLHPIDKLSLLTAIDLSHPGSSSCGIHHMHIAVGTNSDTRISQYSDDKDLKRSVLICLASTSVSASKLVIAEIRQRLMTVRDVASAEILGKLIQLDFDFVDEYIALSIEVLSDVNVE